MPNTQFSLGAVGTLFQQNCGAYEGVAVQIYGTFVGTVSFEGSNDEQNWRSVALTDSASIGATASTVSISSPGLYFGPCPYNYFRARVSAWTSGLVQGNVQYSKTSYPLSSVYVNGGFPTGVPPFLTASGNFGTLARVKAAATTNATSQKTSAGVVTSLHLANTSAAWKFFKFYNKASVPVVGTDVPVFTIGIPPNGRVDLHPTIPLKFATGIAYAITNLVADTDATAVALDDVTGAFNYA